MKKKFILGYNAPEDDFLTEYPNKETASFESEEWCEVEADNLEDAKAKYEAAFLEWQKQQII